MPTLNLTKDEGYRIVIGDNSDFEEVEEKIVDQRRWSTDYEAVYRRKSDNTFWITGFSRGSTEMQEEHPFEHDDPIFTQVEKVPVQSYEWKEVE